MIKYIIEKYTINDPKTKNIINFKGWDIIAEKNIEESKKKYYNLNPKDKDPIKIGSKKYYYCASWYSEQIESYIDELKKYFKDDENIQNIKRK